MKREDDQQLWDLLGQTKPRQLSPFFARNVVRRIRERSARFGWLRSWLSPWRLVPAAGVAVAVVAAILGFHQPARRNPADGPPEVRVKIAPEGFAVDVEMADL